MKRWAILAVVALLAAGCGGGGGTVRLLTHDSFLVSDEVLAQFTAATGLEVEVLRAGDAGSMVNQAVLTAGNPVADVLFGLDNTFLSRALEADLFLAYESPVLAQLIPGLALDPEPYPPFSSHSWTDL